MRGVNDEVLLLLICFFTGDYLTDGFPRVSYFADLSLHLTPQARLGYNMNNMRIKLFATHGVSQMEYLR